MRKVCPNLDREDGLDTVLEVPVPEASVGSSRRRRRTVKAWMRSHMDHQHRREGPAASRADAQLMLGVMGAPLVPQPVEARKALAGRDIKEEALEVSKARYIVEQYVAAAGGETALSAATSMYAMGKVRMSTSKGARGTKKGAGMGSGGAGEVSGGFVVWQKKPELWCVEMVVAGGTKMSAGSDGKVAWRQTPWQQAHASRGPPRPIRRCVQGLDPKSTANLFSSAAWVGEKSIDGDDCFVLRVDAEPSALHARSSADVEVIRHAVWGYFSQRTGLLVRLEDSHLLRIPTQNDAGERKGAAPSENMYWETTMESSICDYRAVDGINIAHAGRTVVSLSRFSSGAAGSVDDADDDARRKRSCTRMEETWSIEEVDFNIAGLSMDCFLPPRDLLVVQQQQKQDHGDKVDTVVAASCTKGICHDVNKAADGDSAGCGIRAAVAKKALVPVMTGLGWFGPAKVVAVDNEDAADESNVNV